MPDKSVTSNRSEIENLLPHRPPFLFVDEVISATPEEIIATQTFGDDDYEFLKGSFPGFDFIPGMILIESMAQCGGAAIRMLNITEGLFGLASIDSAEFFKGVGYHKLIRYVIKNIRLSSKLIKQSGVAYVDGEVVMEATWMCVRMK